MNKTCVCYHTQVLLCDGLIFKVVLMSDNSNLRTLNAFRIEKGLVNQVYNENQLYACG